MKNKEENMLTTKQAKFALSIIVPIFIAVLSICIFATKIPETKFVEDSVESLEESKTTVLKFSGATLATSIAISALPDDFATPIADTIANMNEYFVLILIVLFLERLIVLEGVKWSFILVIPVACGLFVISKFIGKEPIKSWLRNFSYKIAILGLALIVVVPCSTHFTDTVGANYLSYVNETITETTDGADKINEVMTTGNEGETIFEKLSNAFKTAIQGVNDLITYFKNVVKKCMYSIAILVVTTVVMPLLTLLFFRWLFKELFKINIPTLPIKGWGPKPSEKETGKLKELEEVQR